MNNLALVLGDQGEDEQAEEMHREAGRQCDTVLGKDHPLTLASINNLASGAEKAEQARAGGRDASTNTRAVRDGGVLVRC